MHYVCNYNSNGPYFSATQGLFYAFSLRDILFHVRLCMEDGDYQIGVFDDEGEGHLGGRGRARARWRGRLELSSSRLSLVSPRRNERTALAHARV